MIGWLWRILVGRVSSCQHEWETLENRDIGNRKGNVIGSYYILKCKKCGDMRHKSFIA